MKEFFTNEKVKSPFQKASIDEAEEAKLLGMEEYLAMSDEQAFAATFPALNEHTWKNALSKNDFDMSHVVYCLRIKNLTGYMESCFFCGDKKCEGCALPYTTELTFEDMLKKLG